MGIWTADFGQSGMLVRQGAYTPLRTHGSITVSNTVITDVADMLRPQEATGILVSLVDADVLMTLDGSDPTGVGFPLFKDLLPLFIPMNDEVSLSFIRAAGTDADLRYQWVLEES